MSGDDYLYIGLGVLALCAVTMGVMVLTFGALEQEPAQGPVTIYLTRSQILASGGLIVPAGINIVIVEDVSAPADSAETGVPI